jgi:hypothetical protein
VSARPWERWRRVASAGGPGRSGRNELRLRASPRLRAGVYRATLTAFSKQGRPSDIRMVRFRVR